MSETDSPPGAPVPAVEPSRSSPNASAVSTYTTRHPPTDTTKLERALRTLERGR